MAHYIESDTGIEARATVLGYLQRGGSPTYLDRYRASMFGIRAVEALLGGRKNRVTVIKNGEIEDIDLLEGLSDIKTIETEDFKKARMLSI